jgi:hypothetical protein
MEKNMAKHNIPDSQRLLLYISDAGGSMIQTGAHRAFGGRASAARIARAVAELGDLIALEKIHAASSGRPATRLSLTLKGCAAVQYLRPGFEPRRLSVPVLQHWLEELKAEHDPWAMTLIENERDAQYWRSEKAARKAKRDKIEKKIDDAVAAEPKRPSAGRNRSEEDLAARREWAASKWPQKDESVEESEIRTESRIPEPSYYRPTLHAEVQPTAQDTPSNSGLAARIKQAGYTVQNGKVQYSDRWISVEDWMQKEGWRLQ